MKRFEQKVWKEQHHIIDLINCTGRTFKQMLRALSFEFQLARSLSVLQNVELVLYFNLFSRDIIWLNPRPSECLLYWSFFCFLVGIFLTCFRMTTLHIYIQSPHFCWDTYYCELWNWKQLSNTWHVLWSLPLQIYMCVLYSPLRYIDIEYRLSIYQHVWKISISIWSFWKYWYR